MFLRNRLLKLVTLTTMVVLLTACGKSSATEDANKKITEIAATVQAELTQISALTPSVTPTLQATVTSTPAPATATLAVQPTSATKTVFATASGPSADNAAFGADVTVPDGTVVSPGATFVKTWTVKNTGSTTWTTDYQLVYLEGLVASNNTFAVKIPKAVAPGGSLDISVTFTAPAEYGTYISYWKMYSAAGYIFGDQVNVNFVVGSTPAPTTTGTVVSGTVTAGTTTITPTVVVTP